MPTSCALQDDDEVYQAQIALTDSDFQCILYAKRHATRGKDRP
jgi:hypothetical protein